jgi:hypothetical protein
MDHKYEPRNTHMKNVVKGSDPYYRIGPRRPFWLYQLGYAVLVLILLIASFASLFVIAEALR